MSLRLVQPGSGPDRPLVLAYHVGAFDVLRDALPGACIVAQVGGDYPMPMPVASAEETAHALVRVPWRRSALVLVGWSAGCQAVRAHLLAGVEPDAVLTLDGTHGSIPLQAWQVDPWRQLALEARRGTRLWVATCTQQMYVERLPPGQRFSATRTVLEAALGVELPAGAEKHERALHVYSHPSAAIDATAHAREQTVYLVELLVRHVRPWLDGRADTNPAPLAPEEAARLARLSDDLAAGRYGLEDALAGLEAPPATLPTGAAAPEPPAPAQAPPTRGERLVAWYRAERAAGVREVPPGSGTGPRVREYLAACVRNGWPLGLTAGAWCAAMATFGLRETAQPGDYDWPVRAGGIEIEQDALAAGRWQAGRWHPIAEVIAGAWTPRVGDLAICERPGPAWQRHVVAVTAWQAGEMRTIGGNESDEIREGPRELAGVLGFVAV